jgi:radial spoke head protein 4A
LAGEWVELPDVRPSLLQASRMIRYIFSGNLKKNIVTNPHFPGTEADLLRCQIARITYGTTIAPSINNFTFDKDAPYKPLEKNDEGTKLKSNDYLSMKNWIHYLPGILKEGRLVHFEREAPEGVDAEEFMNKIKKADPFDTRMQTIGDDKTLLSVIPGVKIPAWKMQYVYDDKIYIHPEIINDPEETDPNNLKDTTVNYTMICLRSLRWPGAYTIRTKGQNHNIYFGWGQKFPEYGIGQSFVYESFPGIPEDRDDYIEIPEPNSPPHEKNDDDGGDKPRPSSVGPDDDY